MANNHSGTELEAVTCSGLPEETSGTLSVCIAQRHLADGGESDVARPAAQCGAQNGLRRLARNQPNNVAVDIAKIFRIMHLAGWQDAAPGCDGVCRSCRAVCFHCGSIGKGRSGPALQDTACRKYMPSEPSWFEIFEFGTYAIRDAATLWPQRAERKSVAVGAQRRTSA